MARFGGGTVADFNVRTNGETIAIRARHGLFGIKDFGVVTEPEEYAGRILVPHWQPTAASRTALRPSDVQQEKHYELMESIYTAFRRTVWILYGRYGQDVTTGEKKSMLEMIEGIRQLNLTILGLSPGTTIEQARARTDKAITAVLQAIGQPRKISKRLAKARVEALQTGGDSLGRFNPSAAAARAVSAEQLLRHRLEEIMRIDPQIERRRKAYLDAIHIADAYIFGPWHFVRKMLQHDYVGKLVRDGKLRPKLVVSAQCRTYAEDLRMLDYNPYRRACQLSAHDLETVAKLLISNSLTGLQQDEIRSRLGLVAGAMDLKYQQLLLERLIFKISRSLMGGPMIGWRDISQRVLKISTAIERIEEREFRYPHFREARPHLRTALGMLRQQRLAQLEDIRTELKSASRLM